MKRLPTAALLACAQHVTRAHSSLRAQLSFPAQASELRALPALLLLPLPSSARRLRSSSFLTRNEKRSDRNARAPFEIYSLRPTRLRV